MKTFGKILIGVGAVVGVGALACYGLKKLMEKTDCCGCCDGKCDCEEKGCDETCECECHCDEKKVEAPAEVVEAAEVVTTVEEPTAE